MAHVDKLTCTICKKIMKNEISVMAHMKRHNDGGTRTTHVAHLCLKCGKSFKSSTSLRDHERSNCGKAPRYQCDICNKFLTTAGILKAHKLVHSGVRDFACQFCGKKFALKHQVRAHERIHTGEKKYKCSYCPEAFIHHSTFEIHISTHTGVKKYACTGCGERFTCFSNLKSHRKSHSNTCGQQVAIKNEHQSEVQDSSSDSN